MFNACCFGSHLTSFAKLFFKEYIIPLSSSSRVVELSVDSFTSDLPLLAMERAETNEKEKLNPILKTSFIQYR